MPPLPQASVAAWLLPILLLLVASPFLLPVQGDSSSPECRSQMKTCAPGAPCADLVIDGPRAQSTARVEIADIPVTSCAVFEGCTVPGRRKLLRFDLAVANVGSADLPVGVPSAPSLKPCFEWSSCHAHYHFTGFATYKLVNAAGLVLGTGAKASSCLQDAYRWPNSSAPVLPADQMYWCANQGIHRGYQDVYGAHLDCQWIDVTTVAPGAYTLQVSVNDNRVLAEENYNNNVVSFPVVVPADGTIPNPPQPTSCTQYGGCSSCAAATGCGWCGGSPGVAAGCAYGSFLGPAVGACADWRWGTAQCAAQTSCSAQTTCSTCAAVSGCGWCPSTNRCEPGSASGPSSGQACAAWQFGPTNKCGACSSFTACGGCTGATGCGFCQSNGLCLPGTWLGPSGLSCSSWAWSHTQCTSTPPPDPDPTQGSCRGSDMVRTGQTAAGTCPSGTTSVPSGTSCQLACNTGYSRSAGGFQTCTNGVWGGTQPTCVPDSCTMPALPAGTANGGCGAPGALLASGSSCTYTVLSGWTLQSGSLTRTCLAGSFTTAAPVLVQSTTPPPPSCSNQGTCASCAAVTGCGWCPSTNKCQPGSASGPASGVGCPAWQFGPNHQCGVCESYSECGGCTGATGCGFCQSNGKCQAGTWLGPAGTTCSSWAWSRTQCTAAPASLSISCALYQDCTSCTAARGCGFCPATGTCSAGTWLGPSSGSCPTWMWAGATCADASVAVPPNLSLAAMQRRARTNAPSEAHYVVSHRMLSLSVNSTAAAVDDDAADDPVLASLYPAVDPLSLVSSLGLTLDELLKADAAGNYFKLPSMINLGFKHLAAPGDRGGNFLKERDLDVDLARAERPTPKDAHVAQAALDDASDLVPKQPLPAAIDPWDPDPLNPLLPHGHRELLHEHVTHTPGKAETGAAAAKSAPIATLMATAALTLLLQLVL